MVSWYPSSRKVPLTCFVQSWGTSRVPYRDRTRRDIRRGFSEVGSSLGISMKSGLSLNPFKKAAVTSKSITLNFFPDDLRVAALAIKLLAIDSPGVPENRVSRSMASRANSRATKHAFGLGHSAVPLFVMTRLADSITDSGLSSASLRSTTSYTPLSANFCSSTFFASVIKPSVSDLSFDVCSGRPRSP